MARLARDAKSTTRLGGDTSTASRLARLTELRRLLPLVAAGLFLLALRLPVWRITLTAPQYVEPLVVELYAYPRLGGDYAEVQLLNHYVGFYYPDPVHVDPNYEVSDGAIATPEWALAPVAFVAVALASAVAALAPDRAIARALTGLFVGTVAVFAAMGAVAQYRLRQAGHALDPNAPVAGVDGFTPPLIGSYEVANISGSSGLAAGGYLAAIGVLALAVAWYLRDADATVRDLPALLDGSVRRVRAAIRRWRGFVPGRANRANERGRSSRANERGRSSRANERGRSSRANERGGEPVEETSRSTADGDPKPGSNPGGDPP